MTTGSSRWNIRRPYAGPRGLPHHHQGVPGAPPAPFRPALNPLHLFPGRVIAWFIPERGVRRDGSGRVTSVADHSGNGYDAKAQTGDVALDPTGGPDGEPCFRNGGTGWMSTGWTPPQPSARPYALYFFARQDAFVPNAALVGNAGGRGTVRNNTTAPNVIAANGVLSPNLPMATGVWYRICASFAHSSQDFLRVGPNSTPLGDLGDNPGNGLFSFFANSVYSGGFVASNGRLSEILLLEGPLTAGDFSTIDAYGRARRPSSVF